jgi:hypothetical protein
VVEGKVLVELKALTKLEEVHKAQALNYLKAYRLEIGLLINFGSKSLEFKRLILFSTISGIRKSVKSAILTMSKVHGIKSLNRECTLGLDGLYALL